MPDKKIDENAWSIREAFPNELSFIYSTWLNSYRYDSFIGKACRNTVFFSEYPTVLDEILDKAKVLVASFPDSPNVILSYLVYEPNILHYLFTKEVYRKNGIAMSLVVSAFGDLLKHGIYFSHRTFTAEPILQKYESYLNFNPFKLYKQISGGI